MIINVNEKFRLGSDTMSWRIEQSSKVKGQTHWKPISWHQTVGHAAKRLVEMQLMDSDCVGLAEGLAELDRLTQQLTAALAPCLKLSVDRVDGK